jgi:hypothetical protein
MYMQSRNHREILFLSSPDKLAIIFTLAGSSLNFLQSLVLAGYILAAVYHIGSMIS